MSSHHRITRAAQPAPKLPASPRTVPSKTVSLRTPPRPTRYALERHHVVLPPRATVAPPEPRATQSRPQSALAAYLQCLRADLYRKQRRTDTRALLRALVSDMGFKHVFWFRTAALTRNHKLLRYAAYPLVRLVYRHYQHKHGVWLSPATRVGAGLFLEHMSDIVVNSRAVIGNNCNLANGVTIGQTNRGKHQGTPVLGDNVFVGPGAKILGNVRVGDNVAIGANCLVVTDVPDNAVIAAQPGQVISQSGSAGYVNNTLERAGDAQP